VTAAKISVTQLSAITADFGSITAGTVTGVTITGGVLQTADTGKRIQITGSDNYIRVYDSDGTMKASIGESGSFNNAIIGANRSSSSKITASFVNGNGTALSVVGATSLSSALSGAAVTASHLSTGSGSHGLRGQALSGGSGLVGVSAASGGYGLYAESGGIGPFTGAHPGMLLKTDEAVPGDIVVDDKVLARKDISNALTQVSRSSKERQRNIIGVLESRRPFSKDGLVNVDLSAARRKTFMAKYDLAVINGLGEGQMNVCGLGGDIEVGDFICSSAIPGKGQRQNDENGKADDMRRRCTVARARESVKFTDAAEVKKMAVTYKSG
jgi:hypothetical protein